MALQHQRGAHRFAGKHEVQDDSSASIDPSDAIDVLESAVVVLQSRRLWGYVEEHPALKRVINVLHETIESAGLPSTP